MRIRVLGLTTSSSFMWTLLLFIGVGFLKQQRYFLSAISELSDTKLSRWLERDPPKSKLFRQNAGIKPRPLLVSPRHTCSIRNETIEVPMAPRFVILGAQKAGTSFLVDALRRHPQLVYASDEEIMEFHFLDWNVEVRDDKRNRLMEELGLQSEDELWCHYRREYSSYWNATLLKQDTSLIAFEKTPSYLFHGYYLPAIMLKVCPWKPKLLAILRNPVDRAWSHYNMDISINKKMRPVPFKTYIDKEVEIMRKLGLTNMPFLQGSTPYKPHDFQPANLSQDELDKAHKIVFRRIFLNNYLQRGMYVYHLRKWLGAFGPSHLLVVKYEDLYGDQRQHYFDRILDFLGVATMPMPQQLGSVNKSSQGRDKHWSSTTYSRTLSTTTRNYLTSFFEPYNAELEGLLGSEWKDVWK